MILLIGGEKGGTGKTTIAINLAVMRTIKVKDVLLIDAGKQMSATYWCALRDSLNIEPRIASVQKLGDDIHKDILEMSRKYKDIIIDTDGFDSKELRSALIAADKFISPFKPSQIDFWTLKKMNTLIETSQIINSKLDANIMINITSTNHKSKDAVHARDFVSEFKSLKLLNSSLASRIEYVHSPIKGLAAIEFNKKNKEVVNFYQEIFNERY